MSKKSMWISIVVVVLIILGLWWWFSSTPATQSGTNQPAAAAAASAPTAQSANAAMIQVTADISKAYLAKNAAGLSALSAEFQSTVALLVAFQPQLTAQVNAAQLSNVPNYSTANAALIDFSKKLSMLQASTLTLSNAAMINTNFSALEVDLSKIQTVLSAKAH
jgi:hypothetical protein